MNPEVAAIFAEVRALHASIRQKRGTMVGIECKMGQFRVLEATKVGRKTTYQYLTGFQSHGECVSHMRALANG